MSPSSPLDQAVWTWLKKTLGSAFWTDLVRDGAKALIVAVALLLTGIVSKMNDVALWGSGVVIALLSLIVASVLMWRGRNNVNPSSSAVNTTLVFTGMFTFVAVVLLLAGAVVLISS